MARFPCLQVRMLGRGREGGQARVRMTQASAWCMDAWEGGREVVIRRLHWRSEN
jgi:hypothetical protein